MSQAPQQVIGGTRMPLQVHPTSIYPATKREQVLILSLPSAPFLSLHFLSGKWGS